MSGPRRWPVQIGGWTWAHRATAAGFLALLVYSWWQPWGFLQGSPTATTLLGWIPFVDPLAALEVAVAARSVTLTVVCGVAIPLALAIVLGRFFCGWLCPLGLVLDLHFELRQWLRKRLLAQGIRLPQWSFGGDIKYWLLAICVGISAVGSVPIFTTFSPINLMVLGLMGLSMVAGITVVGLCLLELFAPRSFCRAICPLGACYSLVGRFALFRVRVRPGAERLSCGRCTMRCPMGIRVMEDHVLSGHSSVDDPECTRCGSCVDSCSGRALELGFRASKNGGPCR